MMNKLLLTIFISILIGFIFIILLKKIMLYEDIFFTLHDKSLLSRFAKTYIMYFTTGIGFIWILVWLLLQENGFQGYSFYEIPVGSLIGFYTIVFISRISYFLSRSTKEPVFKLSSIFEGSSILSIIAIAHLSDKIDIFEFLIIYFSQLTSIVDLPLLNLYNFIFILVIYPFYYTLISEFFIFLFLKAEKFKK